jgi:hypothetical protein
VREAKIDKARILRKGRNLEGIKGGETAGSILYLFLQSIQK